MRKLNKRLVSLKSLDKRRLKAVYVFSLLLILGLFGRIVNLPLLGENVFYSISDKDIMYLKTTMKILGEIAFASGALHVYVSDKFKRGIKFLEIDKLNNFVDSKDFDPEITSIHAFSSCKMGNNKKNSTVNIFGQPHEYENIYVADSSVIPDSTGVNPQGTVMAFASVIANEYCRYKNKIN